MITYQYEILVYLKPHTRPIIHHEDILSGETAEMLHKIIYADDTDKIKDKLNQMGKLRWELVSVVDDKDQVTYYLKKLIFNYGKYI